MATTASRLKEPRPGDPRPTDRVKQHEPDTPFVVTTVTRRGRYLAYEEFDVESAGVLGTEVLRDLLSLAQRGEHREWRIVRDVIVRAARRWELTDPAHYEAASFINALADLVVAASRALDWRSPIDAQIATERREHEWIETERRTRAEEFSERMRVARAAKRAAGASPSAAPPAPHP